MDKEIQKKIIDWISNIESFTRDQLPSFLDELLAFSAMKHWIGISGLFCFSIVLICLCRFFYKKDKGEFEKGKFYAYGWGFSSFIFGGLSLITTNIMIGEIICLCKCYMAPKLYLLDYFLGKT